MFDTLPEPVQELADFQILLARAHQALGQMEAAQDLLLPIVEAKPELSDAHHLLGDIEEDLGNNEKANAHFLRTRTLDLAAFEEAPASEKDSFTKSLATVTSELRPLLPEDPEVATAPLPTEAEVLGGMDPRVLVHFDPEKTRISLFVANFYAEFAEIHDPEEWAPILRLAIISELAEPLGLSNDEEAALGGDGPSPG
jgi:tetratricopeptide (TPR) repeat protein